MQGDINRLIASNIGLVYKQLNKYHLAKDPEAESIGYEALYNAVLDFDESKGTKLSTLATVYIYNALGSYVRTLNKKRQLEVLSYNNTTYTDEGESKEFVDFIPAPYTVEELFIRKELNEKVQQAYKEMCDKLSNDKHKQILTKWQESEYTATTVELANEVGVSQPYVSQVINNFKFKLRQRLGEYYYD